MEAAEFVLGLFFVNFFLGLRSSIIDHIFFFQLFLVIFHRTYLKAQKGKGLMNWAIKGKGPFIDIGTWNVLFRSSLLTTLENFAMASSVLNRAGSSAIKSVCAAALRIRSYAKVATGTDIVSAAPNVSLQKARTWDEGVASKFSTTPIKDIFKVLF